MAITLLLTGTTGNLGAYLLHALCQQPNIVHVYCLNRNSSASSQQAESFRQRGLDLAINASQPTVEYLTADFSHPTFGLSKDIYTTLQSSVTHILHNAWPVDFNRHFSSFEPSIRGVQNLIDFALACTTSSHGAALFFVSSISAAGNWGALPGARTTVPEVELDDWKVARLGYGQSKMVSERLVAAASRQSGLVAGVCRVGQVAGPVMRGEAGMWPKREWLPSLIESSRAMGVLPRTLGPMDAVDWVPVDVLAEVMTELLLSLGGGDRSRKAQFYHVVNPAVVSWNELLPGIQGELHRDMKIVSFVEWVRMLEDSGQESHDLEHNPAAKLLPFFKTLQDRAIRMPWARATILETKHTRIKSSALATLQRCDAAWMQLWMKQWSKS